MKRVRLIVNPSSGVDKGASLLPDINALLRAIAEEIDVTMTTTFSDAEQAAARAVAEGCDAIYAAGGDGTLNGVVRGVMAAGSGAARIPIGVVPVGTGNDFAKALGLGEGLDEALDALTEPRVIDVDVGTMNDLPFINTSAGGFVADVSGQVTEELKDLAGKAAYVIGGARALLGSIPFAVRVAVQDAGPDGAPRFEEPLRLRMFAVCNARFIGGGYPIAPEALIDDGLADVLMVPDVPMLDFLGVLQGIAAGQHQQRSDVVHFRASAFELAFDRAVHVNTDGEVLESTSCRYRVHHRAARFFCGRRPHARAEPVPFRA
jgi:diacylglycerol kinase (ATP)